jgi:hypothetical protein
LSQYKARRQQQSAFYRRGLALGIGRLGGIAGPLIAGLL